jgi:hypothetical protein
MKEPHLSKSFLGTLSLICLTVFSAFSQDEKKDVSFFTGISPVILERNATEVSLSNSLNSFWVAQKEYLPDVAATRVRDRQRFTRVEQLLRLSYGFSKNKNWDLSAELKFAHARLDDAARSSPFLVFNKQEILDNNETFLANNSYHGLSTLGVRLRGTPFKSIPELTLQGTYAQPVAPTKDKRKAFNSQRKQVGASATYFIQSGDNLFCFFQADWNTFLKSTDFNFTGHQPALSTSIVVNAWENELFVFPGMSYSTTYSSTFYRLNQQFFGTLGVFYQPNPKFSVLMNWQLPLIFDSGSPNIDYVKNSFTGFTVGVRTLIN